MHNNILTVHRNCKTYVVLTLKCALILSIICHLSQLCLYLSDTMWCMWHILLCRGLWVRMARLDVVEHPGTFGILHFTYCVLGHTKSFSFFVWVLERRPYLVSDIHNSTGSCQLNDRLSQRPLLIMWGTTIWFQWFELAANFMQYLKSVFMQPLCS